MQEIRAAEIATLLRGRMGLVIGSSITKYPNSLDEVNAKLAELGQTTAEPTFLLTADKLIEKGASDEQIKTTIRDLVDKQKKSAALSHVGKLRWAAVLSASLDSHFYDAFRADADRRGMRQTITEMNDLLISPPQRTIPIFNLLGSCPRDKFAYSTVTYLERKATWRHAVKDFGTLVKDSPVMCIGMSDSVWVLIDLITEMIGDRSAVPSSLLFMADDPICVNVQVSQLLKGRTRLVKVCGSISDICRAAAEAEKNSYAPRFEFPADDSDPLSPLREFDDVATIVNDHLTARLEKTEQAQLRDLLFQPSIPRWDPYVYNLDFRRTIGGTLHANLSATLSERESRTEACVLSGGVGTGKTVIMKRLAWDLARDGNLVLWLKPSSYRDGARTLRELIKKIASIDRTKKDAIVVFMDDPLGFGSLTPKDVVFAAKASEVDMLLIESLRTSEWGAWDHGFLVGGLSIKAHYELPDALDPMEWDALPDYLVSLGVAQDHPSADGLMSGVQGHLTKDTLSMLYWLLPETRVVFGSSIRDEYHRLGDVAGLTKVIIGTINKSTAFLKFAYEMVAVAEKYHASLPIEVLVSALGIQYHEWVDATKGDAPAWGLLYAESSDDGMTVTYRTRNAIISRMIVEALNGGSIVRTGELRMLVTMLQACTGSTPVYREFCARVLIPHDKIMHLDFEEGLQLYEEAIAALPHPDKSLIHHMGLWIKDKGKNASLATEVLERALVTPAFPYQRGEDDSNIHTSLAATILLGINQGSQTVDEGKVQIMDHLSKARARTSFNTRAVHVQANLISHLADKVPDCHSPDYMSMLNQAVGDIDHALLILQTDMSQSSHMLEDIKMLEQIREEVLVKVATVEDLKADAEKAWTDFESQEGFVLVARKLLAKARDVGKKYDVPFSYCINAIDRIQESGKITSPALHAVLVQIYYHWKVRRQLFSGNTPIDWTFLRDNCGPVVKSTAGQQDPLYIHIHALALAHLGDWQQANNLYQQLRRANLPQHILWVPRDYLLHDTGGVRTVQGVMRVLQDRQFLYCDELQTDFIAERRDRWPNQGETAHAAIEFSFAGPKAVDPRQ